jgi:hypothetical protein
MDRYKIVVAGGRKYIIHDTKYGDNEVAWFFDFDLCQQFIQYQNLKDKLINLIDKHATDDFDREFE